MNLGEFIDTFRDAIARRVVASYPPLYRPSESAAALPPLLRAPLGAQADAIRAATLSLGAHQGTTVVGEMGTGKTYIAVAAASAAGFRRILVLCPPHLLSKWKREVGQTAPDARAVIVRSITDLERLRTSIGSGPLFAVMSREKAKLSYRWTPAVTMRWAASGGRLVRDEETGEPFRVPCCTDCAAQVTDKDGVPLAPADLGRRKHACAACGSPLWQADASGPARYPLSDYVKHRMRGFFDLLVTDEVHEYKGRGSAQGIAAGVLADACGKSLSLSGTLMGGYSSTLFHLLYRFSPEIRTEFARSDEHRWIQRYGFEEVSMGKPDDDALEDGRFSRRRSYRKVVREKPGLVPSALFHIIGNTLFLRLSDVASGLPGYDEQVSCARWTPRRTPRATPSAPPTTRCSRSCARSWPTPSGPAPSGCSPPICRRCSLTRTGAPEGIPSSTRGRAMSSSRCPRSPRSGSTPRRRRCSTWWRPSGWRDAACWSTPPTPARATSRAGWRRS